MEFLLSKYKQWFLFCAAISIAYTYVNANTSIFKFDYFTVENGLSDDVVKAFTQDSLGVIWAATPHGLNRFNGSKFEVFKSESKQSVLSHSHTNYLLLDDSKRLWIASDVGINVFNSDKETFLHYIPYPIKTKYINPQGILSIAKNSKGEIWLGGRDGLYELREEEDSTWIKIHISNIIKERKHKFPLSVYQDMCFINDNNILLSTAQGAYIYNIPSAEVRPLFNNKNLNSKINCCYKDNFGNVWLGTRKNGLIQVRFNEGYTSILKKNFLSGKNSNHIKIGNHIQCITEDKFGRIWVGTKGNGILIYEVKNGENVLVHHIVSSKAQVKSLSSNNVISLFCDDKNIMWIGTQGNGICKYDPNKIKFGSYIIDNLQWQTGKESTISAICEDKYGNIWMGTDLNEILVHNPYLNTTKRLIHPDIQSPIITLAYDKEDIIWAGAQLNKGKVFKIVLNKNYGSQPNLNNLGLFKYSVPSVKEGSTDVNSTHEIYINNKNQIWIGTWFGGLATFEFKGSHRDTDPEILQYFPKDTITNKSSYIVTSIVEDKYGEMYIGTRSAGVFKFNKTEGTFSSLNFPEYNDRLKHVYSLTINSYNNLLIGTVNNGLFICNSKLNQVSNYTLLEGLASNSIRKVLTDENNYVWMSSSRGITFLNPKNGAIKNFTTEDGLTSNSFYIKSGTIGHNGRFYFGGVDGYVHFDPDTLLQKSIIQPRIALSDLYCNYEKVEINDSIGVLSKSIYIADKIVLPPWVKVFSLEFTSIVYSFPERIEYEFMLDGFNNEWIRTNYENNRASYSNLPKGQYTFKVRAVGSDNLSKSETRELYIKVLPRFYETTAFIIIAIVIVVVILFFLVRLREANLRRQKIVLERKVEQRTIDLREQNDILSDTIEELEVAKDKLVQAEKMSSLGVLTSGIAHELNNPINFISSGNMGLNVYVNKLEEHLNKIPLDVYANNIKKEELDEIFKSIHKVIESMQVGVDRSVDIIKSLAIFSHPSEDSYFDSDLHEIIESSLLILKNKYKDKAVVKYKKSNLPKIECNPGKLSQVFVNLISNAIDAIESEGEIKIETRYEHEMIVIRISDNGHGIPDHVLSKIFDPFFTTKQVGQGTGLGLSIVFSIIQSHQGTIKAKSEEKKGTTFIIKLPRKLKY